MVVIHIEHAVSEYASWKRAFDRDPVGRQAGGVRRYRVYRSVSDPGRVAIDLEFDDRPTALAFEAGLRRLWSSAAVGGLGIGRPEASVLEVAEAVEVGPV